MRREVRTVPIKELYLGLYDGPHATPKPADDGPVYLGIGNVTDDGRLDLSSIRHIAEEDFAQWTRRVEPRQNDLVFTYEATLNRYAIIPDGFRGCLGRRMALIRTDPSKVDHRWLHYYFFSPAWREVIKNNMLSGATVDRIPLTTFPDYPVNVPDLPTQRRIAGILSAYDELIANNQRRIAILEEMARALYREWFVKLNVPGVQMNEGEQLPEGWSIMSIAERFDTVLGGTPSRSNRGYWSGGTVPWINSGMINELRVTKATEYITEEALDNSSAKMMPQGTTVIAITGATLGQVSYLEIDCCANQSVVGIIDRSGEANEWVYFMMLDRIHEIIQHATGGAQQHINKEVVNNTRIILPDEATLRRFKSAASPMFDQIRVLLLQNENLRRTRDLLLPRLMSGRVEFGTTAIEQP